MTDSVAPTQPTRKRALLKKIVAIVLVLIAGKWTLRTFFVEGEKASLASMVPTLQPGEQFLFRKDAYGFRQRRLPERGDVVVFDSPDRPKTTSVSRVIGLPGDTIRIEGGAVFVNEFRIATCVAGPAPMKVNDEERPLIIVVELIGDRAYLVAHDQSVLQKREHAHSSESGDDHGHQHGHGAGKEGPFAVREGEVFVLGDNRENSDDSRSWRDGSGVGVPVAMIKGRATTIWLSLDGASTSSGRFSATSLTDTPRCPAWMPAETCAAAERCLANRPARETTTPSSATGNSLPSAATGTPPAPPPVITSTPPASPN